MRDRAVHYWVSDFWKDPDMAISYEIDKEHCTVELLFDSPPSIEDFEAVMPGLVKDVASEMVDQGG